MTPTMTPTMTPHLTRYVKAAVFYRIAIFAVLAFLAFAVLML